MEFELRIIKDSRWPTEFQNEWIRLFARCYMVSEQKALSVMEKYELNDSWCCAMYAEDKLVGCYSGLVLEWQERKIFLSTDTMSDGSIRGGTSKMAGLLYEKLSQSGFALVLGYPNDNIRKIRQRKLGWTIEGELFAWVGVPLLRFLFTNQVDNGLWKVRRPNSGFFGAKYPLLKLLGRTRFYGPWFGVPFTLAATSPGLFYFKVPEFLVRRKTFGFRALGDCRDAEEILRARLSQLDLETIDLP